MLNFVQASPQLSILYTLKYLNTPTKDKMQQYLTLQIHNKKLTHINEVRAFQHGKYLGPMESAAMIFDLKQHELFPPIQKLEVHLENANGHRTYFIPTPGQTQRHLEVPKTTLTEFFDLCAQDDNAANLTYSKVSEHMPGTGSQKYGPGGPEGPYPLGGCITLAQAPGTVFFSEFSSSTSKGLHLLQI